MKRVRYCANFQVLFVLLLTLAPSGYGASEKLLGKELGNPRIETKLQELALDKRVCLVVESFSGHSSSVDVSAICALGGVIESRSKSFIRLSIPIVQLDALASQVSGVAFVRQPYPVRSLPVTSQGVGLTGASGFHSAGFEGQGVKVAIIDLGFSNLTSARDEGELPNIVFTRDYSGTGLETGTSHGTGVAEIVADVAPAASLYLMKISDEVDLENAVQDCIDNGVRVINHSAGWFNTNFYDGTGTIGGIANTARSNNILWANSAGNQGSDGHWQGAFVDVDVDGEHDFGVGSDYIDGDMVDEGTRVYVDAGDTIHIYMTWDDWAASDEDYDLYLYNSAGVIVASSENWQSGAQAPTEAISYTPSSSGYFEINIYNYDAPSQPEIELFTFTDSRIGVGLEDHIAGSSIVAPANSADVIAVGAIRHSQWTTGPQENFSSLGPSNASRYTPSIVKPDICGPDGVSNYTYGSFFGTSASSPHVAGAAALLLSEEPSRTVADLQAKLESDAVDMGVAGNDNIYGVGRLSLQCSTAPTVVINFPDPGLETAIRDAIGKPTGDIYDTDLIGLTFLVTGERNISNLEGIQHCVDLTELQLDRNQIVDINPLSGLTNLIKLELGGNQISDVGPLSSLTNLNHLSLFANQIIDISALSSLTNLELLNLWGNQVNDISTLSALTDLTMLRLGSNQIADISSLSGLINLTILSLENNQIVDISALAGLINLAETHMFANQIIDIAPLENLVNLTTLWLSINQIIDISPLSGLINLTRLELYNNQISDIAPLVSNAGIDSGDDVNIRRNHLCLYPGSEDLENIEELLSRDVSIEYDEQTCLETNSIDYVVAHWVNGDLDPNDPCQISLVQILQAIAWWAEDAVVPYTGGQTIDLLGILDLIGKWANDTCIEQTATPQSILHTVPLSASQSADIIEATRQIVMESTGVEDRLAVTVTLTAKQAISGLALEENLPEGWSLIPIDNAGAAFKEEASQWLWLTVAAGEILTVRYQLSPSINATLLSMTGMIRAASPSFEVEVAGYVGVPLESSVQEGTLEVVAFPNPVRDIHTVAFQARGERATDVEAMRVEIYDLAAQLVYRSEQNGASLEWHTETLSGDYLANGVYLCRIALLIDGVWKIEEIKKLTVLR